MEKLLGEIAAQRIMLAQLLAYVAAGQEDRELFLADFREASLRSLGASQIDGRGGVSDAVRSEASSIIAETCDTAGRAEYRK